MGFSTKGLNNLILWYSIWSSNSSKSFSALIGLLCFLSRKILSSFISSELFTDSVSILLLSFSELLLVSLLLIKFIEFFRLALFVFLFMIRFISRILLFSSFSISFICFLYLSTFFSFSKLLFNSLFFSRFISSFSLPSKII